MENSSRYFENRDCEYYPCHDSDEINCLFCYCPLYSMKCPGNYTIIDKGDRRIKSCINCLFPHKPENYATIIRILKNRGDGPCGSDDPLREK